MRLRPFLYISTAVACVVLSFAGGARWQAVRDSRQRSDVQEDSKKSATRKSDEDGKARKQRLLEYPTVVQQVSNPATLLASPYREGLIMTQCRGVSEDLKKDFLAVFRAKKDGLPTIEASLRRNMRLKLEVVPFDQAPAGTHRLFLADDISEFELPIYWVQSFTHDDPLLRIASDRGRMQFVNRLDNSVVKSPISIPCGDTTSPFYFFAGNWQLYSPHAEEIMLGDTPGTVRRAVKRMHAVLKERGTRLIFAPVPQAASLYPEVGLGSYDGRELKSTGPANGATLKLLQALREDGVEVCDLTSYFVRERTFVHEGKEYPAWRTEDTHWSSWAAGEAAKLIAGMIARDQGVAGSALAKASTAGTFTTQWQSRELPGDVSALEVVKSLGIEIPVVPSHDLQVRPSDEASKALLESNDPAASVHLVGDSHLQVWGDTQSGIKAHLAKELGQPVHVAWMAGGGRHGAPHHWWKDCGGRLPKVVIWMLSERDLPLGDWYEVESGAGATK